MKHEHDWKLAYISRSNGNAVDVMICKVCEEFKEEDHVSQDKRPNDRGTHQTTNPWRGIE